MIQTGAGEQYKNRVRPWNHQNIRGILLIAIPTQAIMAFVRLLAIVALALGASQLASADTTCSTGQTVDNAACCCSYHLRPEEI
jgi:hypothetical protein